jgi:hypothetical protein
MAVNGWELYVHPLFHSQPIHLVEQVEALAKKNLAAHKEEAAAKLLATMNRPIRELGCQTTKLWIKERCGSAKIRTMDEVNADENI